MGQNLDREVQELLLRVSLAAFWNLVKEVGFSCTGWPPASWKAVGQSLVARLGRCGCGSVLSCLDYYNNGNAVNFLHQPVLWEFIQLVKGGIFLALKKLAEGEPMEQMFASRERGPGFGAFLQLSDADQGAIATLWTETVLLGVKT